MPRSMTAFARVQKSCDIGAITWEIRSVNHRYLEPGLKLPDEFKILEPVIRKQIGKYLTRGKIDATLQYTLNQVAQPPLQFNENLVSGLCQLEQKVLNITQTSKKLSMFEILNWPGVVSNIERDMSPLLLLAEKTLIQTLKQLQLSREKEGKALNKMISNRCQQINQIVNVIRKNYPTIIATLHEKWRNHLNKKISNWADDINDSRLEQELAILAQKLDVDEELDRIETHVAEVENVLNSQEAIGRRLDFIMQELNREANTIASKLQDNTVTQCSINLKVLIEQIREQVQNIE